MDIEVFSAGLGLAENTSISIVRIYKTVSIIHHNDVFISLSAR